MKLTKLILCGLVFASSVLSTGYALKCPDAAVLKAVGFTQIKLDPYISTAMTIGYFNTDRQWGLSTFLTLEEARAPAQNVLIDLNKSLADLQYVKQSNEGSKKFYCIYRFDHGQRPAIVMTRL
ncbi:MAG: hypothetical protein P1U34_07440 [Coxiellaceae bacterium]|nr:hypothetical protein [Coxiellaceae bacterium]